jgi:hypothetical protein
MPDFQSCVTTKVGDLRDGGHRLDEGSIPYIGPFLVEPSGSLLFAIAVWNYGFGVKHDTNDLRDALYQAVQPIVTTHTGYNSLGEINRDLVPSLNDHPWPGCDGPVFGWAIRITATGLARSIAASPNKRSSVGPVTVRSQVGCGASSKYMVTYQIVQVGTP